MGSVRSLYTTGDNDPEIEPVQLYRHYLYCDACGSFDLQSLQTPQDEARKRKRRRLAQIAILSSMLVVVSGWRALNLVPSLPVLAFLPVGIALLLVFRGSLVWSVQASQAAHNGEPAEWVEALLETKTASIGMLREYCASCIDESAA
jgi:hypothetical protein